MALIVKHALIRSFITIPLFPIKIRLAYFWETLGNLFHVSIFEILLTKQFCQVPARR